MELKLYRRMNGLTQEQVADYLGIPKKTYQNYERESATLTRTFSALWLTAMESRSTSWSGGMTTVPTLRSSPMTSVTSLTHIEG